MAAKKRQKMAAKCLQIENLPVIRYFVARHVAPHCKRIVRLIVRLCPGPPEDSAEVQNHEELINIRNSKYAFGVVHVHGAIWKERGLLNSQGKSIKHAKQNLKLFEAVQLPEKGAIMHIKAHQKVNSKLIKGNELTDRDAKQAAKGEALTEQLTDEELAQGRLYSPLSNIREVSIHIAVKVKGPAQEIQFSGIKWQDGHRHVPTEVVDKIATMSPPANTKETQSFLGLVGFWRMHIPDYSQLVGSLYQVTWKKNHFKWSPEQQQVFEQIKQEIACAVSLGPVQTGPAVQNILYTAVGEQGLTWTLWQRTTGET
ncbi:hypothetical protein TURU_010594 [Turdus rufiventris]|nr:hypothetical protein TURU_010594 [Turdus rufiventris]